MATAEIGATGAAEEKELKIVENEDGTVVITDPNETRDPAEGGDGGAGESGEREGTSHVDDDDDGPTLQEELESAGADDKAREAIRERRRNERKSKKENAKRREDELRASLRSREQEILGLNERLSLVERGVTGSELARLDEAIGQAEGATTSYKTIIDEATKRSDGSAVADATENLMKARDRVRDLKAIRQQMTRPQPQERAPAQRAMPDPALVAHARAWVERNSWYNPRGGDIDSDLAIVVDQNLAKEMSPTTAEYWAELDKRIKRYLPHRGGAGNGGIVDPAAPRKPGKSVVTGSGRESTEPSGGKTFTLSAVRVQALKDAGMWDDPKARADAIKRYREYDRTAAANAKT